MGLGFRELSSMGPLTIPPLYYPLWFTLNCRYSRLFKAPGGALTTIITPLSRFCFAFLCVYGGGESQ